MSEKAEVAAILAVLNTALSPKVAYDVSKVPATRPAEYVVVHLTRRFGGQSRVNARKGLTGRRLTIRGTSRTSADNARLMLDTCEEAVENVPLVVEGETSTPPQFETATPVGEDEGWFSGARNYTYTIRP